MTVRDPYTGVERPAPPRPRSSLHRWWPAFAIAAIAIGVGVVEWRNSEHAPPAPHAVSAAQPSSIGAAPLATPGVATTPAATPDDLARATAALVQANDRLSNDSMLLIAIAVLQALVLAGQLFLYGQQKRAGRN